MSLPFKVFIPARYASSRLPAKALLDIGGRPLIQHVYEAACLSSASRSIIVTDDDRIRDAAESFGASVIMTSPQARSGTERIIETVIKTQEQDSTIIVNVQGDEYGLPPSLIDQVAAVLHRHPRAVMATLYEAINRPDDFTDPNVVKVVFDAQQRALYFSRAPIPARAGQQGEGPGSQACRHVGIYAYRVGFLKEYANLPVCALEQSEQLEQLRVLHAGYTVQLEEAADGGGLGIDTPADLELARDLHRRHRRR